MASKPLVFNKDRTVTYPPEEKQKNMLKYLFWYSSVNDVAKEADLNSLCNNLYKRLRKILPNGTIVIQSKKRLSNKTDYDFSSDCIYCNRWNECSQLIAFLRHLRNSIAHGYIRKVGMKWLIYDEDDFGNMTAKGEISTITLDKIFKEILG